MQTNKGGGIHFQVHAVIPGIGSVSLHRYLVGAPAGVLVDHQNRVCFDFRRSNLRIATYSQSSCNRGKYFKRGNLSRYKGVRPGGIDRWYAVVVREGHQHRAGPFFCEEDAARGYDELARKHHGEFASLNFPDDRPPLDSY